MEKFENKGELIVAMLVGAAIGGVLGVLFAPDKGCETRKKLLGKSDELTEAMKQKVQSFFNDIQEGGGKVKDSISDLLDKENTRS